MNNKMFSLFLIFSFVFSLSFPTLAFADTSPTRLAGSDRYSTAAEIAKQGWTQSDYAVLVYGANFPDALAATPLAKKYDAPILLTTTNNLSSATKQTLADLQVKNVFIIGGTGVISTNIESEIHKMGITTTRISGKDRYDTSYNVNQYLEGEKNTPIVISYGGNFPDALAISSFAAFNNWPILLVQTDALPEKMKDFISDNQPSDIYITGGVGVISANIESQIKSIAPNAIITRFAGQDRFDTATQIIQEFSSSPQNLYLASGFGFADALAGSVFAAKSGDPILLIDPSSPVVPPSLVEYLSKLHDTNDNLNITCFGGAAVVPPSVSNNVTDFLEGTLDIDSIVSIDNITSSVNENDSYSLPSTVSTKLYNGTTKNVAVEWNTTTVDTSEAGTYKFYGTVDGYSGNVNLTLNVLGKIFYIENIFLNIYRGDTITLPKTVKASFYEGGVVERDVPIKWDNSKTLDPNVLGNTQYVNGTVEGYSDENGNPIDITLYLHVMIPSNSNESPINVWNKGFYSYTTKEFYSAGIQDNIIGTPELTLIVESVSDKDITAFEFTCQLYDSFDRPVKRLGGNDNTFKGIVQDANLKVSGNNQDIRFGVYTFNLVLYDLAQQVKNIKITSVKFSDGKVWNSK